MKDKGDVERERERERERIHVFLRFQWNWKGSLDGPTLVDCMGSDWMMLVDVMVLDLVWLCVLQQQQRITAEDHSRGSQHHSITASR